jgi:hypothetical protein
MVLIRSLYRPSFELITLKIQVQSVSRNGMDRFHFDLAEIQVKAFERILVWNGSGRWCAILTAEKHFTWPKRNHWKLSFSWCFKHELKLEVLFLMYHAELDSLIWGYSLMIYSLTRFTEPIHSYVTNHIHIWRVPSYENHSSKGADLCFLISEENDVLLMTW